MRIINEKYQMLYTPEELSEYAIPEKSLFFDIETTGLNKVTTSLYLIGCGYYEDNHLCTRFFFADDPCEELQIIKEFFSFIENFDYVIHFNGTKFDLPYLEYKAIKYGIDNPLHSKESLDIYRIIKPLRYIIFRESMRQKVIEDFMGIERNDEYNGGELIEVYHRYVLKRDENDFSLLMLHNREDVLGMHKIIPILNYLKLFKLQISFEGYDENEYSDFNGNIQKEILLRFNYNICIPKSFSVISENIYYKFDASNNKLTIRVPIITGVMNHYYENYKDYYYLIAEKKCIHKSIASFVDKSQIVKATKESCYVESSGDFLPSLGMKVDNLFGYEYKDRNSYVLKPNVINDAFANDYGSHLLNFMLSSKPKKHSRNNKKPEC